MRDPAAEVREQRQDRKFRIGRRQREHFVPPREAEQHVHRFRPERLEHRHVAEHRRHTRDELAGGALRLGELTGHHRGRCEEVEVVVVVHRRVHAARFRGLDVLAIDLRRLGIARHGALVVARAHVDVRRHVNDMTGGRYERVEPLRARERASRRRRRFDRVDVVMVGADVHRIALEHRLQHRDDFFRAFRRLAVARPQLPRPQIHQALCVERRGVEIVGIAFHDVAHGVLVLNRERSQICLWIVGVPLHQRLDVRALARPSTRLRAGGRVCQERLCALRCVVGRLLARGIDVEVDVRTERERNPPMRHRRGGVELRRAAERADRLVVVEAVDERQTLVEELLRLAALRRDGMIQFAEAGHQRGRPIRSHVGFMLLKQCEEKKNDRHIHFSRRFLSDASARSQPNSITS